MKTAFFGNLVFLMLIVPSLFSAVLPPVFGYFDEFAVIACILWMTLRISWRLVSKRVFVLGAVFVVGIFFIGLLSNILYGVQTNSKIIAQDFFFVIKPYSLLFFALLYCDSQKAASILNFSAKFAFVAIVVVSACCFLDFFMDLGMRQFNLFSFYCGFSGSLAWLMVLFMAICFVCKKRMKLVYLLSLFVILKTTSGLGTLAVLIAPALYFFFEKKGEIKWRYVIVLALLGVFIGQNEIRDYLMNDFAPRYTLFYYAFKTAVDFFPIGGGFASYGGNMAIAAYSKLYEKYGFQNLYGMSSDASNFLMDTYYPLIIGQFGFLGLPLFMYFFALVLKRYVLAISNSHLRCWSLFLYGTWLVAGLGFGTGSNWGCAIYLFVGIIYKASLAESEKGSA